MSVYNALFSVYASAVPPQLQPFNFHENTNTGDLIIVHCTVLKGDTPIGLKWLFKGRNIDVDDQVQITAMGNRVSSLTIPSVRGEHAGEYACVADNVAGRARHSAHLKINGTFTSAESFQESFFVVKHTRLLSKQTNGESVVHYNNISVHFLNQWFV